MPPGGPNLPPPIPDTPPPGPEKRRRRSSWTALRARAATIGTVAGLFLFLLIIGSAGGYFYAKFVNTPAPPKTPITSLSSDEIAKLGEIGTNLGNAGQTLNIGADALFRGKVDVGGELTVGGRLSANGPATLSQLNITGDTTAAGLNVRSNFNVDGATTLQRSLTVAQLASFAGGINVTGNASFNALNANSISVRTINLAGPLIIGHLQTQGPTPTLVAGGSLGGGGTANISGNDTAGTVTFNTGSGPSAGVLGTITFRAAYTSAVHVIISPISGPAASTPVYVTRTSGGWQARTDSAPPAGAVLSFDYIVTQ